MSLSSRDKAVQEFPCQGVLENRQGSTRRGDKSLQRLRRRKQGSSLTPGRGAGRVSEA